MIHPGFGILFALIFERSSKWQVFALFKRPSGELIPGVRKISLGNGLTRYIFSSGLVDGIRPKEYTRRLNESDFLNEYGFVVVLDEDGGTIKFSGSEFRLVSPWLIFVETEAHFEVPCSRGAHQDWDGLVWDGLVEQMATLFAEAADAP